LLGLYRAALLHTSISSDSLSSFPLPTFLSHPPAPSSFPLFPPTFVAFRPFRPLPTFSASSTFSCLLQRLCPPIPRPPPPLSFNPPRRPLAHPSRLTYLQHFPPSPPSFLNLVPLSLSSFSQPRHPPGHPSPSRRRRRAPSRSRSLSLSLGLYPETAPADKQTADTLQFYAIVSFFICLLAPRSFE
jgi:hypothetical protein